MAVGGWYKKPLLDIAKDDNDVNCVYPLISEDEHEWLGTPYNWLYYNIAWDANGYADSNVFVVDYLPKEVNEPNMISDGGVYDGNEHTVTWTLGNIAANDFDEFQIRVGVNYWARPGGVITNKAQIEGDEYLSWHIIDTNVCSWGSEIIYVDKDANGFSNGTSWDDAYTDLQDGLTGARNCGAAVTDIWVAEGVYKPVESTDVEDYEDYSFELLEDVGLFGHFAGIGTYETSTTQRDFSDANDTTTLEGQIGESVSYAVYDILKADNIENAILDGFTIRGAYSGSGIYLNASDVSIVNCKFKNNSNYGIEAYNYSSPDIHNCLFMENTSQGVRATSHCWPSVSYCTFDGNDTTSQGLHMATYTVVDVDESIFKDHTTDGIYGSSGTLTLTDSAIEGNNDNGLEISDVTTTMTNCSIKNSNDRGIAASNSDLTVEHSLIANNYINGLYTSGGSNLTLENSVIRYNGEEGIELNDNLATTITNNWIHNNGDRQVSTRGSGLRFTSQSSVPLVRNNTIYDNYLYGIESSEYGADPNILNCIIYGNDTNDLYRENDTFDTVNYCNLQSSHPTGTGNITVDPGFANVISDANDLHLGEESQCKDTGDPNGSYGSETDIDGENRVYYGCVDMGADEYYRSPADFDENGDVNFIDYATFAAAWDSEPNDENYDEDCDLEDNNVIDFNDLALFCEDWLWEKAGDEGWMMCMGGGGSMLKGMSMMESDSLMLSAIESLETRPERLVAKSQKFYDITPEVTISAMQKALDAQEVDIEVSIKEILEWLDEIWFSGDLKEFMTEEEYLEFRKVLECGGY